MKEEEEEEEEKRSTTNSTSRHNYVARDNTCKGVRSKNANAARGPTVELVRIYSYVFWHFHRYAFKSRPPQSRVFDLVWVCLKQRIFISAVGVREGMYVQELTLSGVIANDEK